MGRMAIKPKGKDATDMVAANDLLALFERMARERWAYQWGAAREGWAAYRQALRDVPQQEEFPDRIACPQMPENQ